MSAPASTYAQALINAALSGWLEQLTTVQRNLRRNPDLALTLNNANALPTQRESAIGSLLPSNTSPEVGKFVRLLAQQGDLRLLDEIIRHIRTTVPALGDESNVIVTSAHELSSTEKDKLEVKLAQDHGEGLRIRYEVEPELLGGLRIRVGDQVIDRTVAARLEALRGRLVG